MNAKEIGTLCKLGVMVCFALAASNRCCGAGVAAFKEQSYHPDSAAVIVSYTSLELSGPVAKILAGGRTTMRPVGTFVSRVDIPSSLADFIVTPAQFQPVRDKLAEVEGFARRFPKAEPILQNVIASLKSHVAEFSSGKVRYEGNWITNSDYAAREARRKEVERQMREKEETRVAAMEKLAEEREKFAAEQAAKGLTLYKGKWLPKDEAAKAQREDFVKDTAKKEIISKSVIAGVYSIFQVTDDSMLIKIHQGKIGNRGINTDIAALLGTRSGLNAEGDYYKDDLYWCGTYSYENKLGDVRTVNAYTHDLDAAVERVIYIASRGLGDPKLAGTTEEPDVGPKNESSVLDNALGSGSGFFVGNKGYLVTNAHVVENGEHFYVLRDGQKHKAKVVAVSKAIDLAVLETGLIVEGVPIGNSPVELGEEAWALGFPQPSLQGIELKMTKGIISSMKGLRDEESRYQIDAAIQSGNSGGPVCNRNGYVIGVAVAKLNALKVAAETGRIPENVNYAVKGTNLLDFLKGNGIDYATDSEKTSYTLKDATKATALVIIEE